MSQAYIGYDLQNALREELLNRAASKPGRTALITLLEKSRDAIQGKTGTTFSL